MGKQIDTVKRKLKYIEARANKAKERIGRTVRSESEYQPTADPGSESTGQLAGTQNRGDKQAGGGGNQRSAGKHSDSAGARQHAAAGKSRATEAEQKLIATEESFNKVKESEEKGEPDTEESAITLPTDSANPGIAKPGEKLAGKGQVRRWEELQKKDYSVPKKNEIMDGYKVNDF